MSTLGCGEQHGFSVELCSKNHVKKFSILNGEGNMVLVEGYLGELEEISLVEGLMLEVKGSNGIIRLEITDVELQQAFGKKAETPVEK